MFNHITSKLLMCLTAVLAATVPAFAAELITNGSFEIVDPNDWQFSGGYSSDPARRADWKSVVNNGLASYDGSDHAFLGKDPVYAQVEQTTTHLITANTQYTLSFYMTNGGVGRWVKGQLYYDDGGVKTDIDGWVLSIGATDTSNNTWDTDTAVFTSIAGQPYIGKPIGIRFTRSNSWSHLDKVSLNAEEILEPIISEQPSNAVYPAGGEIIMSVAATDPSGGTLTYQWYQYVDGINDTPVTGATSETMIITNAQVGDEGEYYCVVGNGLTTTSDTAKAQSMRVVGHWPLDGNLDDIAGGQHGTTAMIDNYVGGIVGSGQAIDFTGDPNFVALPPTDYVSGKGWTITWWEKSTDRAGTDPSVWEVLVASGISHGSDRISFYRYENSYYCFRITDSYSHTISASMPALPPHERQQWHFLAATYNETAELADFYVDGEKVFSDVAVTFGGFGDAITVGNRLNQERPADSVIDDVKLYNYPVTQDEVIAEYFAVQPGTMICQQRPVYDIVLDCVVDLKDFVEIASHWLECGRLPISECTE